MIVSSNYLNIHYDIYGFYSDIEKLEFLIDNDRNLLKGISKKIIFLHRISIHLYNNEYYLNYLISDILYSLRCIMNGQERYFYFNLRSTIENFLKFILNIKKDQTPSIKGLFQDLKSCHPKSNEILRQQYGKYCDYIHNNQHANLNIAKSFLETNKESFKKISTSIHDFNLIISTIVEYFIIRENNSIDSLFYGVKRELKKLIGNSLYSKFQKNKEF